MILISMFYELSEGTVCSLYRKNKLLFYFGLKAGLCNGIGKGETASMCQ